MDTLLKILDFPLEHHWADVVGIVGFPLAIWGIVLAINETGYRRLAMADKKMYTLILHLYDKTKNGEVKWARSVDREFITSFRDYSVGVSPARYTGRNLRDNNVTLKIYDAGGEEIESTASTDFDIDLGALNAYDMLDYIYENARRMALGVDTALDTLLMELGA